MKIILINYKYKNLNGIFWNKNILKIFFFKCINICLIY